jgi:hypothetical protein
MATDDSDCTTLNRAQLEEHDAGPVLSEVEAGQHLEQDIIGHSSAYKHYWT